MKVDRGRPCKKTSADQGFSCRRCGKDGFSRHTSLVRHLRKNHPYDREEAIRGVESRCGDADGARCGVWAKGVTSKTRSTDTTTVGPKKSEEYRRVVPRRVEKGVRSSTITAEKGLLPECVAHGTDQGQTTRPVKPSLSRSGGSGEGVGRVAMMGTDTRLSTVGMGSAATAGRCEMDTLGEAEVSVSVPRILMEEDSGSERGPIVEEVEAVSVMVKIPTKMASSGERTGEDVGCGEKSASYVRAARAGAGEPRTSSSGHIVGEHVVKPGSIGSSKRLKDAGTGDLMIGQRKRRRLSSDSRGRGRPLRCDDCRITFEVRAMWKMHLSLHAKGRQFSCYECGYEAEDRVDFQAHFECREAERDELSDSAEMTGSDDCSD